MTAGATIASHSGSSGVRLELRSQLAQLDGFATSVCRPALLRCRSIILGIRLVVQWSDLKGRDQGITSTSQQDASRIHAHAAPREPEALSGAGRSAQLVDRDCWPGDRRSWVHTATRAGDVGCMCMRRLTGVLSAAVLAVGVGAAPSVAASALTPSSVLSNAGTKRCPAPSTCPPTWAAEGQLRFVVTPVAPSRRELRKALIVRRRIIHSELVNPISDVLVGSGRSTRRSDPVPVPSRWHRRENRS